jgi:peroxiredoxin
VELLVIAPWLIVALGCWLGYALVRQNGRILLRLEAIERKLGSETPIAPDLQSLHQGLARGTIAPSFDLPDLQGRVVSLADFAGRRLVLTFFSPTCTFCQQMASELGAATRARGRDAPQIVLISTGGREENARFAMEHGFECPVLLQHENEIATRYRVGGTPMAYAIAADGTIASDIAIGADAVLALLREPAASPSRWRGASHERRGNKPLDQSRLIRTGLPAGTRAPAIRLPALDDGEVSLEAYRGRHVLLVFSDPDCGPCNVLAPQLEALHRRASDVRVLMVSRGGREANLKKRAEHGLTFPIALQRQWEISREYGMFATPVAYWIDPAGIIAAEVGTGVDQILALGERAGTMRKEAVPTG